MCDIVQRSVYSEYRNATLCITSLHKFQKKDENCVSECAWLKQMKTINEGKNKQTRRQKGDVLQNLLH